LTHAWTAGKVRGIAFGQRQADVLTAEGVTSRNIQHWLVGQQRLAQGRPMDDDAEFRLAEGDLIVVDETQLAGTGRLTEIAALVRNAGAKLLLTGDPAQGGMGQSGALADLADRAVHYELCDVRRFSSHWERDASIRFRDGDVSALTEYDKHGRIIDAGAQEQAEQGAARSWLADTLHGKESLVVVPSNEAAARISAELRAELVSLGRVQEKGVQLGMQGTVAGVGDLIQARHPDRKLGMVNRALFRVQDVREDGSLDVATVSYDRKQGEQLSEPRVIPADYVRDHVTLGYASTEAAAIGRTVDSCYSVVTRDVSRSVAYVMGSRGRQTNRLFVVTQDAGKDPTTGETAEAVRRDAVGVLSDILTRPADALDATALAQLEQAEVAAQAMPASLDPMLTTLSDLNDTRTARLLDQLTAREVITEEDRQAFATDPATRSLSQLLRRTELAGHNPEQLLTSALEARSLDGSNSIAQVAHARIRDIVGDDLSAQVASFHDLIPADADAAYRPVLEQWADAADTRRQTLGAEAAVNPPKWAASLGPVPEDPLARVDWEVKAGWAGAYREMLASVSPLAETDPLGAAPPRGLVEKHAMWTTAHRALALVDGAAAEEEMSEGQLRARVRAYERELNWAPRYVADQLAATYEALHRAEADATIWAARAAAATDADNYAQLAAAVEQSRAEAERYTAMIPELEAADDARARWYAHTAATREAAERARAALRIRGVDIDTPDDRVTAEEWLAAHAADQTEDEQARHITEDDVTDAEVDTPSDEHGRRPWPLPAAWARQSWLRTAAWARQTQHITQDDAADAEVDTPSDEHGENPTEPQHPNNGKQADQTEHQHTHVRQSWLRTAAWARQTQHITQDDAADAEVDTPSDERVFETEVPDIRDTSTRDASEDAAEKEPRRVPLVDETAAAVDRAVNAVREIEAREEWESTQADLDAAEPASSEQTEADRSATLNRYAADDAEAALKAEQVAASDHGTYAGAAAEAG
jgi:AAA domain-containing protein